MVNVEAHHIIQFQAQLMKYASQTVSRLSKYAKFVPVKGEKYAVDGLGTVEAVEVTGKYQPIKFADIEHLRRRMIGKQYIIALPVDDKDVVQILTDPTGDYAQRAMEGMKRRMDKTIYNACFASVFTGKDMDVEVSAADDGVITVDATAGLTKEILDEVNQNFIDNEVAIEEDAMVSLSITGEEHAQLMNELEFISADFVNDKPAITGRLKSANGLQIELFGANSSLPILDVTAAKRDCLALAKDGVILGVWTDMKVEVEKRSDLITTSQIVVTMYIGAVRNEGVRVQKVQTTVS